MALLLEAAATLDAGIETSSHAVVERFFNPLAQHYLVAQSLQRTILRRLYYAYVFFAQSYRTYRRYQDITEQTPKVTARRDP